MKVRHPVATLLAVTAVVAGCSMVPNMDAGSAGCQNTTGKGIASDYAPGVMAVVGGMSAADAASRMEAEGHTIVFNTGGACWCKPPLGGHVTMAWFSPRGAVALGRWG